VVLTGRSWADNADLIDLISDGVGVSLLLPFMTSTDLFLYGRDQKMTVKPMAINIGLDIAI
jgi:hypothetical protein